MNIPRLALLSGLIAWSGAPSPASAQGDPNSGIFDIDAMERNLRGTPEGEAQIKELETHRAEIEAHNAEVRKITGQASPRAAQRGGSVKTGGKGAVPYAKSAAALLKMLPPLPRDCAEATSRAGAVDNPDVEGNKSDGDLKTQPLAAELGRWLSALMRQAGDPLVPPRPGVTSAETDALVRVGELRPRLMQENGAATAANSGALEAERAALAKDLQAATARFGPKEQKACDGGAAPSPHDACHAMVAQHDDADKAARTKFLARISPRYAAELAAVKKAVAESSSALSETRAAFAGAPIPDSGALQGLERMQRDVLTRMLSFHNGIVAAAAFHPR